MHDFAWLSDVYSLVNRRQLEAAADLMFEKIDGMSCAEELHRCDELMGMIDVERRLMIFEPERFEVLLAPLR